VYHGERPWQAPVGFHDLVRPLTDQLKAFVPGFAYQLIDLPAGSGSMSPPSVRCCRRPPPENRSCRPSSTA